MWGAGNPLDISFYTQYNSITCIQRPPKGRNKSGLSQQLVIKCRFYQVDFRSVLYQNSGLLKQWTA